MPECNHTNCPDGARGIECVIATLEASEAELIQETFVSLGHVRDDIRTAVADRTEWVDVRLQVIVSDDTESYDDTVRWGDPSFDTDHRGFWGASSLCGNSDDVALTNIARELVSQVLDACAMA